MVCLIFSNMLSNVILIDSNSIDQLIAVQGKGGEGGWGLEKEFSRSERSFFWINRKQLEELIP